MRQTSPIPSPDPTAPLPGRAGMTLIEVMIVALVLAVALSGMFSALGTAHQTNVHTESEVRVLQQIESIVEEIQTLPYGQVDGFDQSTYTVEGVDPQDGNDHVIEVTVGELYDNVTEVVITAAWSELSGPRSTSLTYLHVNRGG